jgi:hypothetical protein
LLPGSDLRSELRNKRPLAVIKISFNRTIPIGQYRSSNSIEWVVTRYKRISTATAIVPLFRDVIKGLDPSTHTFPGCTTLSGMSENCRCRMGAPTGSTSLPVMCLGSKNISDGIEMAEYKLAVQGTLLFRYCQLGRSTCS